MPSPPVVELATDHGQVKVVPFPEGTRDYDDLRRAAVREPIGRGLRPSVASPGDLARMLGALGREEDIPKLIMMRRLIELNRSRGILDRALTPALQFRRDPPAFRSSS